MRSLRTRLAKLEAQRPPLAAPALAYVPPTPPPEWWAEFVAICRTEPHGRAVLAVAGLSSADIAHILPQETDDGCTV